MLDTLKLYRFFIVRALVGRRRLVNNPEDL
jgi:hypothetical protein